MVVLLTVGITLCFTKMWNSNKDIDVSKIPSYDGKLNSIYSDGTFIYSHNTTTLKTYKYTIADLSLANENEDK